METPLAIPEKAIRNWQGIVDSHSSCPECARKRYPDLNPHK